MIRQHVLAGHFGDGDGHQPELADDEALTRLDLGVSPNGLAFGIGTALELLRAGGLAPTESGIDLLILAIHVHAADSRINRSLCAQDGWTREIRICVPVADPQVWQDAAGTLQAMLRFLTGDRWTIGFRRRPPSLGRLAPEGNARSEGTPYDSISLFSGGLDSLIGAINEIHERRRPYFVSYAGEGAVSRPQADLFDQLLSLTRHGGSNVDRPRLRLAVRFPARLVEGAGKENTTRGRSFLFLALGALAGTGLRQAFELRIPENGFIALNVPLDPTRPGSATTRTTHPFYLRRWNDLLRAVGVEGTIRNPYWKLTKGEMVAGCAGPDLLRRLAAESLSCAHPATKRFSGSADAHCGTCVPCLIRRAAILHAWGAGGDPTRYRCEDLTTQELDSARAAGQQVRAFQYAIDRLRSRPGLAPILVHKPGPLREDLANVDALARVYTQGMEEVGALLQGVTTTSSRG